ncbi:hypothetical protein MCHI_000295 [Candidatus Magnetoovum chiemensis]|nr:hypothetical protein MCHI_000295 [Candidatus Magnetoovum chiemensis]
MGYRWDSVCALCRGQITAFIWLSDILSFDRTVLLFNLYVTYRGIFTDKSYLKIRLAISFPVSHTQDYD